MKSLHNVQKYTSRFRLYNAFLLRFLLFSFVSITFFEIILYFFGSKTYCRTNQTVSPKDVDNVHKHYMPKQKIMKNTACSSDYIIKLYYIIIIKHLLLTQYWSGTILFFFLKRLSSINIGNHMSIWSYWPLDSTNSQKSYQPSSFSSLANTFSFFFYSTTIL